MKRILLCLLILSVFISALTVNISAFSYTQIADDTEWQLHRLINQQRSEGATTFVSLQDAAHIRADELLAGLSHYRPDSRPWYSVLTDRGIGYGADSFEIIGANFSSAESFLAAVLRSEYADQLLGADVHIGVGYSEGSEGKNQNSWCIIAVGCSGISSLSLHYGDIHLTAGGNVSSVDAVLEARCEHNGGYMQVLPNMISGYDADRVGTQIITVGYRGHTSELVMINDYKDVKPGQWFYNSVMNCTEQGYYSGVGDGSFSPAGQMTREMFVTVLGRLAGIDASDYKGSGFSDVKAERWSAPYIKWASDNGIVSGYNDGSFAPARGITRQEICSVVKRYLDKYDITVEQINSEKSFTDDGMIAAWARDAITYCQTRGIISGDASGAFNPAKTATRAEVAVIITNLDDKIK